MRTKVEVADQVEAFVKALAPHPRRAMTQAIKALALDRGDIKLLEGELTGFSRLRVAGHRVIFRELFVPGFRVVRCEFAERRSVVYNLFQQIVLDELSEF